MASSELFTAVKDVADAFDLFRGRYDSRVEGLQERIEELESKRSLPRVHGQQPEPAFHTYHTSAGKLVELPSTVKMADALPAEKAPGVSLERWMAAAVLGEKCDDREAREYAREMKQMTTATSGILIPVEYQSAWIDRLRSNMVLNQAGMRTIAMLGKQQTHAAVTGDPAVTWHAEAGSISAANPTFAARSLTAKTLVARCQCSVEVAQDSPDFGAQLSGVIARAMAAELDRAGLHGSGSSNDPTGIYSTANINTVPGVGTITDYAELLTGVKELLSDNVPLDVATRYAIMSPATWLAYENLATGITSDKTQLPRPRALESTQFLVTNNVSDALGSPETSAVFLGDFSSLLMGVRQEASIEVLKVSTYATNLLLEIVGYVRADFVVTRPTDFAVLTGVAN
jgi:HK97 family phage major capsid protein